MSVENSDAYDLTLDQILQILVDPSAPDSGLDREDDKLTSEGTGKTFLIRENGTIDFLNAESAPIEGNAPRLVFSQD